MSFLLEKSQIVENIENLFKYLKSMNAEGMYISSYDVFLEEYVPREECHRYYFTAFSGSMAEVYVDLPNKRVNLFVDGRYHEQAKIESASVPYLKVHYLDMETRPLNAIFDMVKDLGAKSVVIEGTRTPSTTAKKLSTLSKLIFADEKKMKEIANYQSFIPTKKVYELSDELTGKTSREKASEILNDGEAFFITTLDALAWVSNCRGYQTPCQSTFMGKGLVTKDAIYLLLSRPELVNEELKSHDFLHIMGEGDLAKALEAAKKTGVQKVSYQENILTIADLHDLKEAMGDKIENRPEGILEFHADKNPIELKVMRDSFVRSSKAIAKTIRWCKKAVAKGERVSEWDLAQNIEENYFKEGALALSFGTISGCQGNGAIVHYGDHSKDVVIQEGDAVLLDSGAFFEGGLATDTTRSFVLGAKATKEYILHYTLVLQGLINASMAKVKIGSAGKEIDQLSRGPLQKKGLDYAHGTGHGVGINVHEGGFSLSPKSEVGVMPYRAGSIEPGLYLSGEYGIRLENIIETIKAGDDLVGSVPLTWVTFEDHLIDHSLLDSKQAQWLKDYQNVCEDLGASTSIA